MKKITYSLLSFFVLLITANVNAQLQPNLTIPQLKKHISTLASDEFMGRETGEKGELLAMHYIDSCFKSVGLEPKGTDGYILPFAFTQKVIIGKTTKLIVDGVSFTAGDDFFPMAYSANASATGMAVNVGFGISAPKLDYSDYLNAKDLKGKVFVMEYGTPDHAGPHSKYAEAAEIRTRLDTAIAYGASAVIFINSEKELSNPKAEYKNRITPCSIPVLFADGKAAKALKGNSVKIDLGAELFHQEGTGHDVVGFLDNGAASTVVIGAHYDHLGMGGDESLYRGEPAIHNGADDNASGTAAMIELAHYLKTNGPRSNNYLFIAFTGEEKGLLGSAYWVKNPTFPLEKLNYMINMDMVGRLKTAEPIVIISGVGTSDAWKPAMENVHIDSLGVKMTESGIGPSDHTSFYLHNLPVLHFFSGTHSDYHKPSDDEPLINYPGEIQIMDYIIQLIQKLDTKGKLNFIKTKEESNDDAPRFKVTLGVIPDYTFEGKGMKIDGVSDGKPASKAGLKSGDIVIALGQYNVLDMMSYMKALGKFSKGDKVKVTYLRGKEQLSVEVEF